MDGLWEPAAKHRESSSMFCDHLEGWDREEIWGYMYTYS